MKKVAVIMGSDSDLPVLKGAFEQLKKLEIPFEAHVYSAHRTPVEAAAFASTAREMGFGVLIAAAGKAAHLAGAFGEGLAGKPVVHWEPTIPCVLVLIKGGAHRAVRGGAHHMDVAVLLLDLAQVVDIGVHDHKLYVT